MNAKKITVTNIEEYKIEAIHYLEKNGLSVHDTAAGLIISSKYESWILIPNKKVFRLKHRNFSQHRIRKTTNEYHLQNGKEFTDLAAVVIYIKNHMKSCVGSYHYAKPEGTYFLAKI